MTVRNSGRISEGPLSRAGRLFGGVAQGFAGLVDHLAHLADAAGALRLAAMRAENLGRLAGAAFDRSADLALADAVTVADVHGQTRLSTRMRRM